MAVRVAEGETTLAAGNAAGYKGDDGPYQAMRQIREKILPLMEDAGLDIRSALRRLRDKFDATRLEIATYKGAITDVLEVPDNPTQMKAIETTLNLMGLTQRDTGNTT